MAEPDGGFLVPQRFARDLLLYTTELAEFGPAEARRRLQVRCGVERWLDRADRWPSLGWYCRWRVQRLNATLPEPWHG